MGDTPQFDALNKRYTHAANRLEKVVTAIIADLEANLHLLRKTEEILDTATPAMVELLKAAGNQNAAIELCWETLEEDQHKLTKVKAKCQLLVDRAEQDQRDAKRPRSPLPATPQEVVSQAVKLIRLPQHELPKLSGLYAEWPSFWNQFEVAIDKRDNLSSGHKHSHLRRCLSGETLDLIKTVAITDENYNTATTLPRNRHEDDAMILREIMESLLGTPSVLQPGNLNSLRKLPNVFTEKIEAFKNSGIDEGYFFLTYFFLRKLDSENRHSWDLHNQEELRWTDFRVRVGVTDLRAGAVAGRSKYDQEFARLMDYLMQRVQLWERAVGGAAQKTPSVLRQKPAAAAPSFIPDPPAQNQLCQTQPASFETAGASGKSRLPNRQQRQALRDVFCPSLQSKVHEPFLTRRPQFMKLDTASRRTAVRQHNACYNCLSLSHRQKDCKSPYTCRSCGKRHLSLLHPSAAAGAALEPVDEFDDPQQRPPLGAAVRLPAHEPALLDTSTQKTPSVHEAKGSVVFLCTIQLLVINAYGTVTSLRAMLDTRSHDKLIAKSAAEKHGWDITGKSVSIRGVGVVNLQPLLENCSSPCCIQAVKSTI